VFAKVRERRDLVFIDQRGTGGSNPLNCDLFNPADPQSYFGYFFPLEEVKKCRQQLEPKADLTLYTTPIAMDDLDEVRAALGYEQVNIFGASYGTRAALVYLKQHPKRVRTLTLQGVAPTNQYMPLDFAQANERAVLGIIGECGTDEACNKAFPNLRAEAKAVLDRLMQGPVEVEVQHQEAGSRRQETGNREASRTRVKLSRDLAMEAIRYMLYGTQGAGRVPLFLHLAAQGDFSPLAQAALDSRRRIVATGSNGLYLSITCAEDLPWIKPGEGERLAANTFLGDYRLRQQREACELWPRATIPSDYNVPTKESAPVLILTGEWDPVTPPSNGDAVAKHLPNSLHVVVPDGAHGIDGLEGIDCIERLHAEFVERGMVKGLDMSCVRNIRRRGFALAK
jgi:pimeloyl-ACP methyl ester carboxylesterase